MTRYPDLALTAALLTAAVLLVGWATMPARRRPVLVLPRVPAGVAGEKLTMGYNGPPTTARPTPPPPPPRPSGGSPSAGPSVPHHQPKPAEAEQRSTPWWAWLLLLS